MISIFLKLPKSSLSPTFKGLSAGIISKNLIKRYRENLKSVNFAPKSGSFLLFWAEQELFPIASNQSLKPKF